MIKTGFKSVLKMTLYSKIIYSAKDTRNQHERERAGVGADQEKFD